MYETEIGQVRTEAQRERDRIERQAELARQEVRDEAAHQRARLAHEARTAEERTKREAEIAKGEAEKQAEIEETKVRRMQAVSEKESQAAMSKAREAQFKEFRKLDLPLTKPENLGVAEYIKEVETARKKAHKEGREARKEIAKARDDYFEKVDEAKDEALSQITEQKKGVEAEIASNLIKAEAEITKQYANLMSGVSEWEKEALKELSKYEKALAEMEQFKIVKPEDGKEAVGYNILEAVIAADKGEISEDSLNLLFGGDATREARETLKSAVVLPDGLLLDKTEIKKLKEHDEQYGTNYTDIAVTQGFSAMQEVIGKDIKARDTAVAKLEDYKTEDGYNLLLARAEGITPSEMRLAGFKDDAVNWAENTYKESQRTGVALPGDWSRIVMFNPATGVLLPADEQHKITNTEFESLIKKWEDKAKGKLSSADWDKYLKAKSDSGDIGWVARGIVHSIEDKIGKHPANYAIISSEAANRIAIEGVSALFFVPAKAALPEYTIKDIQPLEWAVGGAQLAAWTMPFIPKGVLPFVSAGAAGIIGYNTAQNWDKLSPGQKALGVVGTVLVSLPALATAIKAIRPVAVKVPTTKGTEITVWRGVQVNGKPIFGISQSKPTLGTWGVKHPSIAQIEAGWHPVTKIETTLLGTTKALKKMGAADTDIKWVKTVWKETVPSFARKPTPAKIEPEAILSGSQRLTPNEIAAVLRVSVSKKWKKLVDMIYGSSTMRPQLKKVLRDWRKWHDIDIQTSMSTEQVATYVDDIVGELRKLKVKVRVNPQQAGTIEKFVGGKWVKITDIHAKGITPDSPITAEGAYGYIYTEAPIKIKVPGVGELRIMTLSETGLRKAGSVTSFQINKIAPAAHRVNDIADLYVVVLNYKGAGVADKLAKALGYTGEELLKVWSKAPHKWSLWTVSPSAAPTTGSPSVAVSIPATFVSSIPASLRSEIEKYSPMPSSMPSSYIMQSSPASVRAVSSSGALSPSLVTSPSIAPSPSPSISVSPNPYTSPSPSPSLMVSPYPSPYPSPKPSPSAVPSPYPSPYPSMVPSPGPTPKPPFPVIPSGADKGKIKYPDGTIVWKMGMFWKIIPPPYTLQKPINSKSPPAGVKVLKGTPQQTLTFIGGKLPFKDVSFDLGVVDGFIDVSKKKIVFSGEGEQTDVGLRMPSPTKGIALQSVRRIKTHPKSKRKYKQEEKPIPSMVASRK